MKNSLHFSPSCSLWSRPAAYPRALCLILARSHTKPQSSALLYTVKSLSFLSGAVFLLSLEVPTPETVRGLRKCRAQIYPTRALFFLRLPGIFHKESLSFICSITHTEKKNNQKPGERDEQSLKKNKKKIRTANRIGPSKRRALV